MSKNLYFLTEQKSKDYIMDLIEKFHLKECANNNKTILKNQDMLISLDDVATSILVYNDTDYDLIGKVKNEFRRL